MERGRQNRAEAGGGAGKPGTGESDQGEKPPTPERTVSGKVRQQLAAMTLDEKLGEMIIAGIAGSTSQRTNKAVVF